MLYFIFVNISYVFADKAFYENHKTFKRYLQNLICKTFFRNNKRTFIIYSLKKILIEFFSSSNRIFT